MRPKGVTDPRSWTWQEVELSFQPHVTGFRNASVFPSHFAACYQYLCFYIFPVLPRIMPCAWHTVIGDKYLLSSEMVEKMMCSPLVFMGCIV